MTVEELSTTVARYLGEERTRSSFESFAVARRISLDPKHEADFQLLRYAEHLLASAIGAASSRLVLSLLLRKRTVSTQAALKLLDDANTAAAAFGAAQTRIEAQSNMLASQVDALKGGVSAMVDADMEEASARLSALQTQQQLGIQALSIANSAPQNVLSLFRN